MRPQEINRNINLAFKRFERDNRLIHFHKCKKHMEKRLEYFRKTDSELDHDAYYMYCFKDEYGEEEIMHQMRYISDRWNCSGRIKFILEVLKQGY